MASLVPHIFSKEKILFTNSDHQAFFYFFLNCNDCLSLKSMVSPSAINFTEGPDTVVPDTAALETLFHMIMFEPEDWNRVQISDRKILY